MAVLRRGDVRDPLTQSRVGRPRALGFSAWLDIVDTIDSRKGTLAQAVAGLARKHRVSTATIRVAYYARRDVARKAIALLRAMGDDNDAIGQFVGDFPNWHDEFGHVPSNVMMPLIRELPRKPFATQGTLHKIRAIYRKSPKKPG